MCHQVVLVRPNRRLPEEVPSKTLPYTIHFEAAGQCLLWGEAFLPGHALHAPIARSDQPQMKAARRIRQQLPAAASDQNHITSARSLPYRFCQPVKVALVRRVQTKALRHTDRFLIQTFQIGIGDMLHGSSLMQQFAVEQLPAKRLRQATADLAATRTVLTRHRDDVHV